MSVKLLGNKNIQIIAKHSFLIVICILMLFPFLWMILSSFKMPDQIFTGEVFKLPTVWKWENYFVAWNSAPFEIFFSNSLIMSGGIVLGQVITCSLAAYAFAWINFRWRNVMFIAVIATAMIPFEATMIPSYLIVNKLGIMNTHLALILPTATGVFGIFLLRQFFLSIPRDLFDASRMDGCGHIGILFRVIMPLSGPVYATLCLFTFLNAWNSYLWPLLVTNTTSMRTVQIGLRYLIDAELGTDWPVLMAASTVVLLPILILFLYSQKHFIRGVANTGLK